MSPQNPASLPKAKLTLPARVGGFSSRDLIFRLAVAGLLLVSIVLLWTSFTRALAPQMKQSRELRTTASRLSAEVDDLDRKWAKADIEQLNQKFALVPSRLFVEPAAIDSWLANLKDQAVPLALEIKASGGQTNVQIAGSEKFPALAPTMAIEISPLPATRESRSPYRRLLELTQLVTAQDKRAHLTELTVEAGANSISYARMGFNFWAGEEAQP